MIRRKACFRKRDLKTAARLLKKVSLNIRPGVDHPIPAELYEPLHGVVTYPAIDAVIFDGNGRFLMMKRDDKYFTGWELVGGYSHRYDGHPKEWLNRLAERDIGARVKLKGFVGIHMWPPGEHAHGVPISLVAVGYLAQKPTKNLERIRLFRRLPKNVVPNHANFVKVARRALLTGRIIPAI